MNTATMLFMRGIGQGALATASAFVLLVICATAVFVTLICAAPLFRKRH